MGYKYIRRNPPEKTSSTGKTGRNLQHFQKNAYMPKGLYISAYGIAPPVSMEALRPVPQERPTVFPRWSPTLLKTGVGAIAQCAGRLNFDRCF